LTFHNTSRMVAATATRVADLFFTLSFHIGAPSRNTGHTFVQRFMPSEVGKWSYTYTFSDGSKAGAGTFDCVAAGRSPGVLQPYEKNPYGASFCTVDSASRHASVRVVESHTS
jgi:hypothetical protein